MGARRTMNTFCYEEWEFDTAEELKEAVRKEVRVCGDRVEKTDDATTIWNFHQNGVRWLGRVKG